MWQNRVMQGGTAHVHSLGSLATQAEKIKFEIERKSSLSNFIFHKSSTYRSVGGVACKLLKIQFLVYFELDCLKFNLCLNL